MSLARPVVVHLLISFNYGSQWCRISQEFSSLFIKGIYLILCFRYNASTEFGAIMRTKISMFSVLRAASGPRVKLVDSKSAVNPPAV